VCGQALSHCVNFTVRDIVKHWKEHRKNLSDIYILVDGEHTLLRYIRINPLVFISILFVCDTKIGAAPVSGYEEKAREFLADMELEGLTLTTIDKAFDHWEVPVDSATAYATSVEGHTGEFGKLPAGTEAAY